MGGSKLDFLEDEDMKSIASSYSSINGPVLQRFGGSDTKRVNINFIRYSHLKTHTHTLTHTHTCKEEGNIIAKLSSLIVKIY